MRLLLFSFLFSARAFCGNTLDEILKNVEDPQTKIKTIDAVINRHPDPRGDFTMRVIESDSNEDGSKDYPRYLAPAPKTGFLMGFNGHIDQEGYNTVQMAEPKGSEWDWAEIKEVNGKLITNRRPHTCLSCHGDVKENPTRWVPRIRSYPDWPGTFGAQHDQMSKEELKKFKNHLKIAKDHPRYKNFITDTTGDEARLSYLTKYARVEDYIKKIPKSMHQKPGDLISYQPELNRRPNLLFGKVLGLHHGRTLAKRAAEGKGLDEYLVLSFVRRCWESRDNIETEKELLELADKIQKAYYSSRPTMTNPTDVFYEWDLVVKNFFNFSTREMSLNNVVEKGDYIHDRYFDGSANIDDVIDAALIGRLTQEKALQIGLPFRRKPAHLHSQYGMNDEEDLQTWDLKSVKNVSAVCKEVVAKANKIMDGILKSHDVGAPAKQH